MLKEKLNLCIVCCCRQEPITIEIHMSMGFITAYYLGHTMQNQMIRDEPWSKSRWPEKRKKKKRFWELCNLGEKCSILSWKPVGFPWWEPARGFCSSCHRWKGKGPRSGQSSEVLHCIFLPFLILNTHKKRFITGYLNGSMLHGTQKLNRKRAVISQ